MRGEIAQAVGNAIKNRRFEMKKTQAELAEALNIDLRTVQNLEAGETLPGGFTLYRIAHVMNLSIDAMFFQEQEASVTRAMLLRRISECDEHQQKVLLATANALLERE